jgi:hypothetical protein
MLFQSKRYTKTVSTVALSFNPISDFIAQEDTNENSNETLKAVKTDDTPNVSFDEGIISLLGQVEQVWLDQSNTEAQAPHPQMEITISDDEETTIETQKFATPNVIQSNGRRQLDFHPEGKTFFYTGVLLLYKQQQFCIYVYATLTSYNTSFFPEVKPTSAPALKSDINDFALPDIDIEPSLDLEELKAMGEDIEMPGEVQDLYHEYPPQESKLSDSTRKESPLAATSLESTPTKSHHVVTHMTPRRSPRNHDQSDSDLQFVIVKLNVTDRSGLHSSIEVPRVLICAHEESTTGQTILDLKRCLQDKGDRRFKMRFDLCKYLRCFIKC